MLKSIEEQWNHFAGKVLSQVPVNSVQYQEMRKSFYAGATVVVLTCERMGEGDVTEDVGANHLESMKNECIQFVEDSLRRHKEMN